MKEKEIKEFLNAAINKAAEETGLRVSWLEVRNVEKNFLGECCLVLEDDFGGEHYVSFEEVGLIEEAYYEFLEFLEKEGPYYM